MDDDPPAARDEADDVVARHRGTAARKGDEHARHTVDGDRTLGVLRLERLRNDGRRRLFPEIVEQLENDLVDGHRAVADCGIHLVGRIERKFFGDLFEALRRDELRERHALALGRLLHHAAPQADIFLLHLLLVEGFDLGARGRGLDEFEPVPGRALAIRGSDDLHHVARFQPGVERDDLAVDLGPRTAVAHFRVNGIGEVDGRRAGRERNDLALRREHEQFRAVQLALDGVHEFLGILEAALQLHDLADPRDALIERRLLAAVFLILPVCRDTVFRRAVHLFRPDLDLERLAEVGDDGGVQRLIEVGFGGRDIVLDAPRDGLPLLVDLAEYLITLVHRSDDDPDGGQIVDLIERLVLVLHLFIDGVEVFGPAEHLAVNVALFQNAVDLFHDEIDEAVALLQLLMDIFDQIFKGGGIEIFEAEVLQLALDLRNTQTSRDRRIDIQRLARHLLLALLGQEIQRTHVVQPVGKFDDDHADVLRHRDEDLAEVFGLLLFLRFEDDLVELCDARNERQNAFAELAADVLLGDGRILDDVMQQRARNGIGVQSEIDQDLRNGARMNEIGLPRGALLVAVRIAREVIGMQQHVPVGTRIIFVDLHEDRFHITPPRAPQPPDRARKRKALSFSRGPRKDVLPSGRSVPVPRIRQARK